MDVEIVAAALAALGAGLSGFVSAYATKLNSQEKQLKEISLEKSGPEKDSRLLEVTAELKKQTGSSKWQGIAATLLTFSQYVIGGILTTSFIQDSISTEIVGFLGLLVLISSLIHQHFRPDLKARFAKERIVALKSLKRSVEDDLFAIREGKLPKDAIHGIRTKVTKALGKIEESEAEDSGKVESESGS